MEAAFDKAPTAANLRGNNPATSSSGLRAAQAQSRSSQPRFHRNICGFRTHFRPGQGTVAILVIRLQPLKMLPRLPGVQP